MNGKFVQNNDLGATPTTNLPLVITTIVLSTITIALFASLQQSTSEELREAATSQSLDADLRQVAAQYHLFDEDPEPALEELQKAAETDREKRRLALMWAAVATGDKEKEREERALSLIDQTTNETGVPILRQVVTRPDAVNDEMRESLISDYGTVAELALVHEQPQDAETYRSVWNRVATGVMIAATLLVFYLLALLLGIGALWNLWRRHRRGEQIARFRTETDAPNLYIEAFAVFVAADALLTVLAYFWGTASWAWIIGILQLASLPFAIGWPLIRGLPWSSVRTALGIHRGEGFMTEIIAGLRGYLLILPVFAVGVLLTGVLGSLVSAGSSESALPTHPDTVGLGSSGSWIVFAVLACIVAPLVEETLFRGALYRGSRRYLGALSSAFLVSAIFGLLHPQGWIAVPALAALAVGFAGLREWRDSLIAPMTAHALHNGLLVIMLYSLSV
jgi:membrane protease YdiL (CAAX protease family)